MPSELSSELGAAELGIFELGSIRALSATGLTISQSDTLSFSDHILAQLDFISLFFSDNLQSFADAVILSGVIVSLTQTAADTLNVWSDAIREIYAYLNNLNETLTLTDGTILGHGYQFDENILQAADSASIIPAVCITFGDSAHNWLDLLVRIPNISLKEFSDNFLLTDELKASFSHRLAVSDLNTITDAILLTFQFLLDNADQITQIDALNVQSSALGALTLSVGETLEMSDSLGNTNNVNNPLSSTAFINFLRRYLNDVPR